MAMQMGLHCDTWNFPALSRVQTESMARLWATIVELSLASCLDCGTPISAALGTPDAREPSDINDDSELSDVNALDAISAPGDLGTDASIQLLLLKSQKLRIQVLKVINETGPQTSYETVVDLSTQIRNACIEASSFFSSRSPDWESAHSFHRKYIDTYLRKHTLLLHRPFMLAAEQDPRFYLSRKICLESCMIMASYTDEMDMPLRKLDDFSNLMIHGSGYLRGGLSLNVIVTLAYELNAQLKEVGGAQGPHPYDPAHELGRAAWQPIIRRLEHIRKQLWQITALGTRSLRSYIMVSAFLAQMRTVEVGGNMKIAFYGAVKEAIQRCVESLKTYLASQPAQATDLNVNMPSLPEGHEFNLNDLVSFQPACNITYSLR